MRFSMNDCFIFINFQAPPKKIPPEWMILRRKYNPYKKIIRGIDLVADNLQKIDKLNVSLCEPDRQSSKKTPSRSSKKVST